MSKNIFVLMPFDSEFDDVFTGVIKEPLEALDCDVKRADDILNSRNILADIVSSIRERDLIIADLSTSNPNVYYELGIAHSFGKPVILLTQDVSLLPFDLRSYRVIPYDTHFSKIQSAISQLSDLVTAFFDGSATFSNPVTDFSSPNGAESEVDDEISQQDDDRGFLDHILAVQKGFGNLTELTNGITDYLNKITKQTEKITARTNRFNEYPSTNSTQKILLYLRVEGLRLRKYAHGIGEINDQYAGNIAAVSQSIESAVISPIIATSDDHTSLREFLDALLGIRSNAQTARSSFSNMLTTVDSIPNMERTYNKSREAFAREIRRFINNIDQTIAMVERIKPIINKIIHN